MEFCRLEGHTSWGSYKLYLFFYEIYVIYLKYRMTEREEETEKCLLFTGSFIPWWAQHPTLGPMAERSQELYPRLLHSWQGPNAGAISTAFPDTLAGKRRSGPEEVQLRILTSTQTCSPSITDDGLPHYATAVAPTIDFKSLRQSLTKTWVKCT